MVNEGNNILDAVTVLRQVYYYPNEREEAATVTVKLRIKESLRSQVEAAAQSKGISMNAEMAHQLERAYDRERTFREVLTTVLGGPRTEAIRRLQSTSAPLPQHISHSRSFDHRRRTRLPLTAIASALRCPTSTTKRFPRVTPVYTRFRCSIG
jgi:hypothetical protein